MWMACDGFYYNNSFKKNVYIFILWIKRAMTVEEAGDLRIVMFAT